MPSTFGSSSTAMVMRKSCDGALGIEPRPGGEEREVLGEILRPDEAGLQREREADEEQQQPDRRGQVAHDADSDVDARSARRARASR